ncbi:hypothetical protein TRFO_18965 [Tritrichomonas foetus]|uniref:Brl1/Brr6 domain-containing protein n=1 Tax=Tritrichomonas foetus TaxID=1144522 RepID=A0A1J4KJN2_9EUKA|nr:hypothetical protein TRFO_18965 [Tritrichomonas foetus]|eukprot:OHT11521.1 hypothetical protein TRFO_18965 [Tritrichomonas foetus]
MISPKTLHNQTITNVDKVFNQQTEAGELIAKTILDMVSHPSTALAIFAPETHYRAERISSWIDFAKRCIYSIIIIICAIRIISVIPEDIQKENNKLKFFDLQRHNDCYNEYIENECNSTDAPALIEKCEQLLKCYEETGIETRVNLLTFEWEVINDFFFYLSKKSAAILGFVCGCFLYCNLCK